MKKYFLLFLICYTPCFASAQGKCESIFDNPPVHKGELIKEEGKPDMWFLGRGWTAMVHLIDGKEIGINKLVVEKTYSSTGFMKIKDYLNNRPSALRDLQLLRAFKEVNIEGLIVPEILEVKVTLTNEPKKPSYFLKYNKDMDLEFLVDGKAKQLTVYLEYHEGTDLETLWDNNQLSESIKKEYNDLVKRIVTYLNKSGNNVIQDKVQLEVGGTDLTEITSTGKVTIGNAKEEFILHPSNVLLTKKGFVLIDPF